MTVSFSLTRCVADGTSKKVGHRKEPLCILDSLLGAQGSPVLSRHQLFSRHCDQILGTNNQNRNKLLGPGDHIMCVQYAEMELNMKNNRQEISSGYNFTVTKCL